LALTVTPNPVNVNGTGAANAQTVHVHETGYLGPFTETDTCGGNAVVALKSGSSGNGPDSDYTVTGVGAVTCDVTFHDAFAQATPTHVVVTTSGFTIQGGHW
jgi:hypothetical protein